MSADASALPGETVADDTPATDDIVTSADDQDAGVGQNSEEDAAADSPPQPPADRAILERVAKEGGIDLRGKYKTDADFIQGYRELAGKLHERDQDAALGRVFKQHEAEFREYLTAKREPAAPNGKQATAAAPEMTVEDYYLLQARVLDPRTGNVREGANPSDVQRFNQAHTALERNIVAVGLRTKDAIAGAVQEIIAEKERQWQEQAAAQQVRSADMQAVDEFMAANSGWLFQDGKSAESGLRPEGDRFWEIANGIYELEQSRGRQRPYVEIFELAEARLLKEQSRLPERPGVKPQGRRKASTVTRSEAASSRLDQMIGKGIGLTEAVTKLVEEGYNLDDLQ